MSRCYPKALALLGQVESLVSLGRASVMGVRRLSVVIPVLLAPLPWLYRAP